MRILAVRGGNLTSLDGPFAVEFGQEPLRRAGLFAITGPTGAGKSTILDALCLALFDQMPRLPREKGVRLGPEGDPNAIFPDDVRTVLRRGAGAGWAEVDFTGIDGKPYRARWEVRRARQKARGALQPQTMTLTSLDGAERFGDGKKSVLEEIERRLGLSFEQFRRAVLLAQGDFATFLKAPPKERSALLELLTGTEIYSRLSIAAHERAAAERQALDRLEAEGGGIGVLEAAEREALEAEAALAAAAVRDGERALEAARAAVAWHRRDAQLEQDERAALDKAEAAAQAWREAEPRRATAARLRRLQPLRPLLAEADRIRAEAAGARTLAERASDALTGARSALEASVRRHAEARRSFEQACRAQQEAEPDLARAAGLDGQTAALEAEAALLLKDRDAAVTAAAASLDALRRTERALADAGEEVVRLETRLRDQAAFEPVAAQWSRWDAALARHAEACGAQRAADDAAARHGAEAERLRAEAEGLEPDLATARERLATAGNALARLRAEPAPALDETRARRLVAAERRDRLTALTAIADSADRLAAAAEEAEAERARLTAEAERDATAARHCADERRIRQAALDEAEAALQRLRLAQREDVETLRSRLVADEPCPVCGSESHPWAAAGAAPLAGLTLDQERRVAALAEEVARLVGAQAVHDAGAQAARRALDTLAARRTADGRAAVALAAEWAEQTHAFDLPPTPDGGLARRRLADVETLLAAVTADEALALDHRRRLDAAEADRRACEAAAGRLVERTDALRRALAEARHAGALETALRDRAAAERDTALADLTEPLAGEAGWRAALAADPARFRAALAERVRAYQNQRSRLDAARQAAEAATADRAARAADHDAARRAAESAETRAAGLADRVAALRTQRAALLDGRPVAAVRAALSDHRHEAEARLERGALARQDDTARLSAAERDLETRGETARACAARADEAEDALGRTAASLGVTVEEARRDLEEPDSALATEEAALAELETARRECALLAAERARLRADHHAAGGPAPLATAPLGTAPLGTAEESAQEADRVAAALEADRARLGLARGRIEADDRNRARLAGLAAALREQRARQGLWARMAHLIGSATGHKMRNFAQSLSLDTLLGHANRHLEELARRYRLERVAGADLEIQVIDREMGDERRGVHSLSGGELFLVSLALALGLSAMAAGSAGGIGTLFIDEGFGSLDPDSLDVALSCLEALQAGGRQVGVISHVPAMVDRIGVQVRVVPLGGGRSRVAVRAAAPVAALEEGLEPVEA